jgi:hypothetical protein
MSPEYTKSFDFLLVLPELLTASRLMESFLLDLKPAGDRLRVRAKIGIERSPGVAVIRDGRGVRKRESSSRRQQQTRPAREKSAVSSA